VNRKAIITVLVASFFSTIVFAKADLPIHGEKAISIFQPLNAGDSSLTKSISVYNQQIKIDLFDDFAVVNSIYWFNNTSGKNIEMRVGIPQVESEFRKVYWLRININDRAPSAARDTNLKEHWQAWMVNFQPGITQVSLYYGVSTSLASKMNCLRYDFSNYKWWKPDSTRGDFWIRMNGGLTTSDIFGVFPDKKFLAGNSIAHGSISELVKDSTGGVLICYRSLDSVPINLSRVNWEMKYSNLTAWNPNEKIIATLLPFSAIDFEGKKTQQNTSPVDTGNGMQWMIGIFLVCAILALFIWSEWQRRRTQ